MLTLGLPRDFDLRRAVCHYGYYQLAPNRWDEQQACLRRVMTITEGKIRLWRVGIRVTQRGCRLQITCASALSRREQILVKRGVRRMLRLDEDFTAFHRLHAGARQRGFGRLFRSPALFEDIVKTMTGCNVTWQNTIRMNRLLCDHVGAGGFPTADELTRWQPHELAQRTKVGYRAEWIVRLARDVVEDNLDLDWFEQPDRNSDELYDRFRHIHGVGAYAAANLCQHVGCYDRLAIDSETYRLFCQLTGIKRPANARTLDPAVRARYAPFGDWKFLAYWYDLYFANPTHLPPPPGN